MNYAQFSPQDLEGLILLAQERMNLAAQQVPGLNEHIAEQQAIVTRFEQQYAFDEAFVRGAIEFIQSGGQQQAPPQRPFQPTHQFAAAPVPQHQFPQAPLPHQLPQPPQQHLTMVGQHQQQSQPHFLHQPEQFQPPQFAPPQMQHHQFGPPPQQQRVQQGPSQPPFPNAPPPQAPLVQDGVSPLPFTAKEAAGLSMAQSGARRSHLMPDGKGGWIPDPNFVDEYGMSPAKEITQEMRDAWARDQQPEVHVLMPGEEGHVPEGGGKLKVKINGSQQSAVDTLEENSHVEIAGEAAAEGPR